jgi:cholest-4-en-3-one 26-monooxygenase
MVQSMVLSPATYEAGDPARNGLPIEEFRRLQTEAPCFRQELDDPTLVPYCWVLTRHEDVLAATRDHKRLSSAEGSTIRRFQPIVAKHGGKPAMMAMDGADHVRNRRIVGRGFVPVVLQAFESRTRAICVEVLERALNKTDVDFVRDIAVEIPLRAAGELIGVPAEDQPKVLKWTNDIATPNDPHQVASIDEVRQSMGSIWDYALKLAELRRMDPEQDLMSKVAAAFEEEQLSEDELQGMLLLLAIGGNETTRNAMTHGLHALLRNPEQMALLRENPEAHIGTAVNEILRWSTPIIHVRRTAVEDIELHGNRISTGDPVAMVLAAANHDPEVFDQPERFDIRRDPNPHITMSAGPHVCLGQAVAKMEIRILLSELLTRTKDIVQTGEIAYTRDSFVRGARTLPVELVAA